MITALIPARGGSVRIPGKNMMKVGDATLLGWAISAAHASVEIDDVVVSSDDELILDRARELGAEIISRPDELAGDDATDYDVVNHFLDYVDKWQQWKGEIEMVVYLRPTTPLRRVAWIDDAISRFKQLKACSGLRSVHQMSESAFKCFTMDSGGRLGRLGGEVDVDLANMPDHNYERTYKPNGAVDIMRPSVIRQGATFGDNCFGYLTPWTVEIDTPADLEYARFLAIKENKHAPLQIDLA